MKKQLQQALAVAGLVVGLTLSALAQAPNGLALKIPFAFTVERQHLPAGDYKVQMIQPGTLLIRSADGKAFTTALTLPVRAKAEQTKGKLIFHRYGKQYFLAQIWVPGTEFGRELFESPLETELAKKMDQHEVAVLFGSSAGGQ